MNTVFGDQILTYIAKLRTRISYYASNIFKEVKDFRSRTLDFIVISLCSLVAIPKERDTLHY